MTYTVYVNFPWKKAKIHDTKCSYYVKRKRNKTQNGFWTEPFEKLDDAWKYAKSTGQPNVETCAHCIEEELG